MFLRIAIFVHVVLFPLKTLDSSDLAGHCDVLLEIIEVDFQRLVRDIRHILRAKNVSDALVLFIEFWHDDVLPSVEVEAIILAADLWYPYHHSERYGEYTLGMIRSTVDVGNH
jgi:hypothetical protein